MSSNCRSIVLFKKFHMFGCAMKYCDIWHCSVCDCAHVSTALQCIDCSPKWWARGWKCNQCHGSCIHLPESWLHRGWVCEACHRISEDWRNHDDRQKSRRRLLQRFPIICVVVHDLAGYDLLRDDVDDEPMQFSPVNKIADVVDLLHTRLRLAFWENIMVCSDMEVLKPLTLLGTLADATGQVHLSAVVVKSESCLKLATNLGMGHRAS